MNKTISSFQEQNERQQNKTGCKYMIYDEEYKWSLQSEIEDNLTRLSKEGWRIVSSNIYNIESIHGPRHHISVILERPIKT